MRLTAQDLKELSIIDGVIDEPLGGDQRDREAAISAVGGAIEKSLSELVGLSCPVLRQRRREKFMAIGPIAA